MTSITLCWGGAPARTRARGRPLSLTMSGCAISPNSASCERVFALLKNLFNEQQMLSLADYVQAALMLNYNNRSVG